jgi:hypothetical protein
MNDVTITSTAMSDTPFKHAKRGDLSSVRNGLFCVLLMAACVLAIYPVANQPCGDDFSYMKTAVGRSVHQSLWLLF